MTNVLLRSTVGEPRPVSDLDQYPVTPPTPSRSAFDMSWEDFCALGAIPIDEMTPRQLERWGLRASELMRSNRGWPAGTPKHADHDAKIDTWAHWHPEPWLFARIGLSPGDYERAQDRRRERNVERGGWDRWIR